MPVTLFTAKSDNWIPRGKAVLRSRANLYGKTTLKIPWLLSVNVAV
jgi:hypothetical protein